MNRDHLDDKARYELLQEKQRSQWEHACRNCGACCGIVDGDPCEHLLILENGKTSCKIYSNRFGLHKTRSGRVFNCVPLRNILNESWPGDYGCVYKRLRHN